MLLLCNNFRPHSWGKWSVIDQGAVQSFKTHNGKPIPDSEYVVGTFYKQQRTCPACGLAQFKETRLIGKVSS